MPLPISSTPTQTLRGAERRGDRHPATAVPGFELGNVPGPGTFPSSNPGTAVAGCRSPRLSAPRSVCVGVELIGNGIAARRCEAAQMIRFGAVVQGPHAKVLQIGNRVPAALADVLCPVVQVSPMLKDILPLR